MLNKKVSIGSWMHTGSSDIAEMMGDAGFDWVAIDLEHSSTEHHQLPDMFRALQLGNTIPLVRIAKPEADDATKVLEAGAKGIIIPNVTSYYDYLHIKHKTTYPPTGLRGVGFNRSNMYGKYFLDYIKFKPILIPMIENVVVIEELDKICKEEPDAVFIGPYDLSASLGKPGEFESEEYKQALSTIIDICNKNNIPAGIHQVNPDKEKLEEKINQGFKFIAYSSDVVMLQDQLQSIGDHLRSDDHHNYTSVNKSQTL